MAIGDIIASQSAVNTINTFQPAVGVEILVTSLSSTLLRITDGAVASLITAGAYSTPASTAVNMKTGINNTYYLRLDAVAGYGSWFSGIQIK